VEDRLALFSARCFAFVKVCRRRHKFENFLADMGERLEGMTLGRYLDSGDYKPGNVRWQTKTQQVAEQMKKRALLAARRKLPVTVRLEEIAA